MTGGDVRGAGEAPRNMTNPRIEAFFDRGAFAVSYVVHDPATKQAAIIDSVMGYDPATGQLDAGPAQPLLRHVEAEGLRVAWHLETHIHADHLSAAHHLQERLGGRLAIGSAITSIQRVFGELFNATEDLKRNAPHFDVLLDDGDRLDLGSLEIEALHVSGHTPADMAFLIGNAAFIGDTLFMPDYGTARTDFPGGDARALYRSIRRILSLPPETRLFMGHDYMAPGRDKYCWETTVREQRAGNIHVHDGVDEESFVAMREQRDATLSVPRLMLPSIQINMRGGRLPETEENGQAYLKIPLSRP